MSYNKPIRRIAIVGTGVIGGMLAASGLAIFLVPAGFCIVERASGLIGRVTGRFRNRSSRIASQGHD